MCCGSKRAQLRIAVANAAASQNSQPPDGMDSRAAAVFVNETDASFNVIGPSGIQYHFAHPGSQVQIDPRDCEMLAKLQQLRQVRGFS